MGILADTNIFLAVALNEPEKPAIISHTIGVELFSTDVLMHEAGNALSAMLKRDRLTKSEARATYEIIAKIPVRPLPSDIPAALALALDLKIYAYDAYVLETARRHALPLMTLDKGMRHLAKQLGVTLVLE